MCLLVRLSKNVKIYPISVEINLQSFQLIGCLPSISGPTKCTRDKEEVLKSSGVYSPAIRIKLLKAFWLSPDVLYISENDQMSLLSTFAGSYTPTVGFWIPLSVLLNVPVVFHIGQCISNQSLDTELICNQMEQISTYYFEMRSLTCCWVFFLWEC